MAFDQELVGRVRRYLRGQKQVSEVRMMGSLMFLVRGAMCAGVRGDELVVRIDAAKREDLLAMRGCRPMRIGRRTTRGFILVAGPATKDPADLAFWLEVGLAFDPKAKSGKRE